METTVQEALSSCNLGKLHEIFTSASFQSLGQAEQKNLCSIVVKAAVEPSSSILNDAFSSTGDSENYDKYVDLFKVVLSQLPTALENAADNILRSKLFDLLVDGEDYREAAQFLSGYRFDDDDESSVYFSKPEEKADVYVKIAECFLHEDEIVEADTFVTKAGASVQALSMQNNGMNNSSMDNEDPAINNDHLALILRYKSTYARVLDANRKFLSAASRYYDLASLGSQTDIIDADDLLEFLGRACTCAILAPSSAQRQRILGLVYNDDRLEQLDSIDHFSTHSRILSKMYMEQVIRRDQDLEAFENSLADHQKALMSDSLTIFQRALIEHNMVAVSQVYSSIYFTALGQLLGLSAEKTEKIAREKIANGSLKACIDQVDGILSFDDDFDIHARKLVQWDGAITSFCMQLNSVVDSVRQAS
jgi:COP9 signalosome complex subunit 4